MDITVNNERAIRAVVSQAVQSYASGFADRHISEVDDPDGVINMKSTMSSLRRSDLTYSTIPRLLVPLTAVSEICSKRWL